MSVNFFSSLVGLDRLQILRARRVGIRRLPVSLIDRLTSLRVLDVANNEIQMIPTDAAPAVTRLRELDLADNRLVDLSALAESMSWRVERVNLAGNPWHCLCGDVATCRRLTAVLDNRTRRLKHLTSRCASLESNSASQTVLDFCRDLVTASDNNQTTLGCPNDRDLEQRVVEEKAIFLWTLLIIAIAVVLVAVFVTLACCYRLSRRYTRLPGRRGPAAGATRRSGYRIVGETAVDFTDVQ